jgi:signal transduction histidine kinase
VRVSADVEAPAAAELDLALDAAAAELEPLLTKGRVELQHEPLPRAALDPRDAQRLFIHLLRSAMSAGATRMALGGTADAQGVTVEMLDDGSPTPEGPDPFAPFARPRGRGPLLGAGVSLPICARIVHRHGGEIATVTRPDGATLVTIRLASPG